MKNAVFSTCMQGAVCVTLRVLLAADQRAQHRRHRVHHQQAGAANRRSSSSCLGLRSGASVGVRQTAEQAVHVSQRGDERVRGADGQDGDALQQRTLLLGR